MQTNIKEPKPDEIDLVVFHKGCTDGFTSVFLFYLYKKWSKKNCLFNVYGCSHGINDSIDFKGKNVLVVDFNFSKERTLKIMNDASSFISLDHHETAKKNLEGISNCHFDLSNSGAYLAFEFLFGKETKKPLFVELVRDRDLWLFEKEGTREFSAFMFYFAEHKFEIWESLLCKDDSFLPDEEMKQNTFPQGKQALIIQKVSIDNAIRSAYTTTYDGKIIKVVNSQEHESEIGDILTNDKKCNLALIWSAVPKAKLLKFSARSKGNNEARLFAQKFAGGGHDQAAGFKIFLDDVNNKKFLDKIFGLVVDK